MTDAIPACETGDLMQGDPARYGDGLGLWPTPRSAGGALGVMLLLRDVCEAAVAARAAHRRAVACGLGGSALEQALDAQALAAEGLSRRLQPRVYY